MSIELEEYIEELMSEALDESNDNKPAMSDQEFIDLMMGGQV